MSNLKVFVLMAGLTALFIVIGGAVAGQTGAVIAFVLALGMNLFAYFNSAKMVLKAYRARIVDRSEAPELYGIVERLAQQAGLPMPTLAIAPHEQPNAFATGRNPENAVVCVTEGILKLVDRDELEGVLAHELGHVKNRDMLLQTITASLSGAITNLARFGMYMPRDSRGGRGGAAGPLMILLGPLAAMIMQFAISRSREFKADATGAEISKKPLALASALGKLEAGARRIPMNVTPAVAPLAQVNPLAAFGGGFMKLFSTHPSTQERIRRLEEIAQRMGGLQSRPGEPPINTPGSGAP
jgi:heat shock protein HtpX